MENSETISEKTCFFMYFFIELVIFFLTNKKHKKVGDAFIYFVGEKISQRKMIYKVQTHNVV